VVTERETVAVGLKCRAENRPTKDCEHCHYGWAMGRRWGCDFMKLSGDALKLLDAQEPVEPVVDIDTWKCGNCGHTLEHQQLLGDNVLFHEQHNYCPECGRAVKWDD
jgi:hypothetical protein